MSEPRDSPAPSGRLARFAVDFRCALAAAVLGCAVFAAVELCATVILAPGDVSLKTGLRLAALAASLGAIAWLVVAPGLWAATLIARLAVWLRSPAAERTYPGLLCPRPRGQKSGPDVRAARLWSAAISAAIYVAASAYLTHFFQAHFKAPLLVAVILAGLQLPLFALAAAAYLALFRALSALARGPARRLGKRSPVGNLAFAVALIAAFALGGLLLLAIAVPQIKPLIPWRYMLAAAACFAGIRGAVAMFAHRGQIFARRRNRTQRVVIGVVCTILLTALTLWRIGADPATKYLAVTGSPPMQSLIDLVRAANDFDSDGYGSLLGENDCYPLDADRHRGARDIPDNGIDENCSGADFSLKVPPSYRTGDVLPVPAAYDKPYNFLLITVDTLRYDHTGFGGYLEKSGRDTTPNLNKLVTRSVSFAFANAPSAGTMASVPAILTSKFFHSGIALNEDVPPHTPPIIKPENVLLSEILKGTGYSTGAVVSHYYFNNWNMDQGFDDFINMNPKRTPYRTTSHIITDLGLQWIAKHTTDRWFLWMHYIDPHGRYVGHPGAQYGETEEDLYDSEIHYTDKHIGRLLRELGRMPVADNTVIIITSDHGDGFKEHGFINHGMALYRELLHVPLIIHVPNNEPHIVNGPVSPLDIVPTVAQLAGADVSALSFEGESLVPQLFYGRDAKHRIVFAETNWPRPLRAAISDKYKLVYHLESNVYELYNLKKDPWEQDNIHNKDRRGMQTMKRYLDDWLERVYYARDAIENQVIGTFKAKGILLSGAPTPEHKTPKLTFDDGNIEVLGFDLAPKPKNRLEVAVYFHATARPSDSFRFRVWAYPASGRASKDAPSPMRGRLQETAGGLFPTSRWRPGEYIRQRFELRLRNDFDGGRWVFGVEARGDRPLEPSTPLVQNKNAGSLGAAVLDSFVVEGSSEPTKP